MWLVETVRNAILFYNTKDMLAFLNENLHTPCWIIRYIKIYEPPNIEESPVRKPHIPLEPLSSS